jgi:hypothetical protein
MMTACEALTWIAFGEAMSKERLGEDFTKQVPIWGTSELDDLLQALDARAAGKYIDGEFGREYLQALRAKARQREGRPVTFRELRDQLAPERDRIKHSEELLKVASRSLCGALAAGRLVAFGRPRFGTEHQSIGATFFMNSGVEMTWWDTAESETGGLGFEDVQFKAAQILSKWPSMPAGDAGASRSGHAAQTRPVSKAALDKWYIQRRDAWPRGKKPPREADDLVDAREHFPKNKVSREMVRVARRELAPESWTKHGRRKSARK